MIFFIDVFKVLFDIIRFESDWFFLICCLYICLVSFWYVFNFDVLIVINILMVLFFLCWEVMGVYFIVVSVG